MSIHLHAMRIRNWASSYPADARSGEWECDFPHWPAVYEAVDSLLANDERCSRLTIDDHRTLLYLLARDNECEIISTAISGRSDLLIRLAKLAASEGEPDAKWQLAHALGSLPVRQEAEGLLAIFVTDSDEYVSRRALLTLGEIRSPQTEAFAQRAWDTELEYQRIAALWALKAVGSESLAGFLQAARDDGREFLVSNANKVSEL